MSGKTSVDQFTGTAAQPTDTRSRDALRAGAPAAAEDDRTPSSRAAALRALVREWRSTGLGIVLAAAVVAGLARVGFIDDYNNTLQVMGFDPDRASLITALIVGAIVAITVAIVGGRRWVAMVAGAAASLIAVYPVFREETRSAIHAHGADGTFDLVGWLLTSVTLALFALIVSWAASTLGADVLSRMRVVRRALGDLAARRNFRWAASRAAAAIGIVVLVGLTLPIFGDMMNFEPDAHMRTGGQPLVGLFGGTSDGSTPTPGPTAVGSAAPSPGLAATGGGRRGPAYADPSGPLVIPADLVPGPVAGSFVTPNALATGRPWAAQVPTGGGRTVSVRLPAPWTGGLQDYSTIDIYLPPGYDAGTQRYPVIYEPHQPLWAWEQGMHVTSLLDEVIRSGAVPPEIVVFIGQYGGPYADSECANSFDGREWFDRYLGVTVPAYLDANYRTIPTAAARSLLGFSSGGYCAAAAITHHPDVFSTAMIFSGYFRAGIKTSTTPTAGRPFNNDPTIEASVSPINVLPQIAPGLRSKLFMTFSADPANHFYGDQITEFAKVADGSGVAIGILPTPLGHSWAAVREQLPGVLAILAARQVQLGVFGGN